MRYYELLELSPSCTEAEIKASYRRLAKRFHPDSGAGDVERFRGIQEAYDTLSDPERRRAYDSRHAAPVSWTGGFEEPIPPFREVFPRAPYRVPPSLELVLTEEEARRGGEALLEIARELSCDRCGGGGFDFFGPCFSCRGEGTRRAYARIRFAIPRGAEPGDVVAARSEDGGRVEAVIRVAFSRATGRLRQHRSDET